MPASTTPWTLRCLTASHRCSRRWPSTVPPDDDNYCFEYKWDGVRAIAYIDGAAGFRLESRNQLDITRRYPELRALADALADHRVVLDGEIVALDDVDRPSFSRLQQRMHVNDAVAIRRLVMRGTDLLHRLRRALARRALADEPAAPEAPPDPGKN
jgi:bifunctional non-homologous end joining protein LigD